MLYRWGCDRPNLAADAAVRSGEAGVALGPFSVTVWAIYGCTAIRSTASNLAGGVASGRLRGNRGALFFLGHLNLHGSSAFFPVLLLVKSPLPFSSPSPSARRCCSARAARLAAMAPLVGAAAIVAIAIPSTINIGLRHILPAFPLLAIVPPSVGRLLARRASARLPSPDCCCSGRSARRPP